MMENAGGICVVLSSLPIGPAMKRYIPEGAFLIAADAGWRNAQALGLTPDLVLGDFDSAPPPENPKALLRLPAEKDDTDTYFALRQALERGFREVRILGGLGGRFDHSLANLQALLFLAKHGVENLLADEHTEVRCRAPGIFRVKAQKGRYLSVLAAEGEVEGVWLRGLKYPLANARLTMDHPLGVSNEFVEDTAEIETKSGYVFVITAEKDENAASGV